jgi:hypothetical protein
MINNILKLSFYIFLILFSVNNKLISSQYVDEEPSSLKKSLISISHPSSDEELRPLKESLIPVSQPSSRGKIVDKELALFKGRSLTLWGVALFAGTDPVSKTIKIVTASKWSHVGLVLSDERGDRYCFESTGSLEEIIYKGMLPQVQIHKWEEVVKSYSGQVATRKFIFEKGAEPDPSIVTNLVIRLLGTPYETNLRALIKAIRRENTIETPSSLFCSELNAQCLMELGYLGKTRPADNYLPRDFSDSEELTLKGCIMDKEILVKDNKRKVSCGCVIL